MGRRRKESSDMLGSSALLLPEFRSLQGLFFTKSLTLNGLDLVGEKSLSVNIIITVGLLFNISTIYFLDIFIDML